MRIHNIYTDENGESHFRDIEVDWTSKRGTSELSDRIPVECIIFRKTPADYDPRLASSALAAVYRQPGCRGADHRE